MKMDVSGLVFLPVVMFHCAAGRRGRTGGMGGGGGRWGGRTSPPPRPNIIFRFHREDVRLDWAMTEIGFGTTLHSARIWYVSRAGGKMVGW